MAELSGLTNGEALVALIRENLLDLVFESIDLESMGTALCPGNCEMEDFLGAESSDEICRPCLKQWLEKPYAGTFTMRDGLFVKAPKRRGRYEA